VIKNVIFILSVLFVFSGCAIFQPDFGVPKQELESSRKAIVVPPKTIPIERKKVILPPQTTPFVKTPPPKKVFQQKSPKKIEVIVNVFSEDIEDFASSKRLINYLDAYPWEKKALYKAYGKHKKLWTKHEIQDFLAIINEDKYLSLCADKRYLDNLIFTTDVAKQDLLYSILLLRYLNNLSHGCSEWVGSNGTILNENSEKYIESDYLLSMLPKNILIERLFTRYIPKEKDFFPAIKRYKLLTKYLEKSDEIKNERLQIEQYKRFENHPDYE